MADFSGVDFLHLDELLSDEERLARDTVREFVTREFLPRIQEHVRQDGSFPMELVPAIAELGLFGANLSRLRLRRHEQRRLRARDAGARARRLGPALLRVGAGRARDVPDPQLRLARRRRSAGCPSWRRARAIGCFGLTEPDFGSNVGGMRTRAVRRGDGWVLNGTKRWITNGTLADVAVVWATTDDGVRGFLVETDRRGFEARDIKGKFSLRALGHVGAVPVTTSRCPRRTGCRRRRACTARSRA